MLYSSNQSCLMIFEDIHILVFYNSNNNKNNNKTDRKKVNRYTSVLYNFCDLLLIFLFRRDLCND